MRVTLFKTIQAPRYYGKIPEFGDYETHLKNTASFTYDADFGTPLAEWFEVTVNDLCHTWFGDGDIDFLDADQCVVVKDWIESHESFIHENNLEEFMSKFVPYLNWAIDHQTGVTVE